jgi:hypothetical protein
MMAFYGALAAAFGWLGIGAVRARRWARDLLLSVTRIWLLTGAATLLLGAVLLPAMVRAMAAPAGVPPEVATAVILAVLGFVALSQVALPAALLLFLRSPDVAATCRARDPRPQFTDGCPDRVLTLAAVWALVALSVLVVPAYDFAFPCFGVLLRGAAGVLPWLFVLAAGVVLAWGSFRRARWAWWSGIAATAGAALATVLTTVVVGPADMLQALQPVGAGEGGRASMPTLSVGALVAGWLVVWGSFLAYLWSLRPFFATVSGEGTDA